MLETRAPVDHSVLGLAGLLVALEFGQVFKPSPRFFLAPGEEGADAVDVALARLGLVAGVARVDEGDPIAFGDLGEFGAGKFLGHLVDDGDVAAIQRSLPRPGEELISRNGDGDGRLLAVDELVEDFAFPLAADGLGVVPGLG